MYKIFVINLQSEIGRKIHMQKILESRGIINYEFINAIDAENIHNYKFRIYDNYNRPFISRGREILKGEIGCALSHYYLWKRIKDDKIENAIILEDDIDIVENFEEQIIKLLKTNLNYDMIYLGRLKLHDHYPEIIENDIYINENICECSDSFNTIGYMLSYNGVSKLLSSSFINNIIPVDEFLCALYGKYDWENVYIKNNIKFNVFALNQDIVTIKKGNCFESNIDISEPYYNIGSNIRTYELNTKEFTEEDINDLINYIASTGIAYTINLTKDKMYSVEKFIFDIVQKHCKYTLNKSLDDVVISFWAKKKEYKFEHIHLHVDHCDYTSIIHCECNRNPILSTLTYNNENNSPTLITNIHNEYLENKFNHKDISIKNEFIDSIKQFGLFFPKKWKHISFDGGNYIHGECYLDNTPSDRNVLVIAIWNKCDKPLYVTEFDTNAYLFYRCFKKQYPIKKKEYLKNENVVDMNESKMDYTNIKNTQNNRNIIKHMEKMIKTKNRNMMFAYKHFLENNKLTNNVILNLSNVRIDNYDNEKTNGLSIFCVNDNIELQQKILDCFNNMNYNSKFNIFNKKNKDYLESFIFDIINYHTSKLSIKHPYYVEIEKRKKQSKITIETESFPLLQICVFFRNVEIPCVFSNIDEKSFTYKKFSKINNLFLIKPKQLEHLLYANDYCHYISDDHMLINIWKKNEILSKNGRYISSKYITTTNDNLSHFNVKQIDNVYPEQIIDDINNIVIENILYNNMEDNEVYIRTTEEAIKLIIKNSSEKTNASVFFDPNDIKGNFFLSIK
jgi:collagen beta-1,O-galactosyltransferase